MREIPCPDCFSRKSALSDLGNGECKHCKGKGFLFTAVDATVGVITGGNVIPTTPCSMCAETKQCQSCGGKGYVLVPDNDSEPAKPFPGILKNNFLPANSPELPYPYKRKKKKKSKDDEDGKKKNQSNENINKPIPQTKYRPQAEQTWQTIVIKLGLLIALILGAIWLAEKIVLPLVVINIATAFLICALVFSRAQTVFYVLAIVGVAYYILDYNSGWQTKSLSNDFASFANVIPYFLYLNVAAGAVAAYLLMRSFFNQREEEPSGAFSKRNIILASSIVVVSAAIIFAQKKYGGNQQSNHVGQPVITHTKNWNDAQSSFLRQRELLHKSDSSITRIFSDFEQSSLKNDPARAQPRYDKAHKAQHTIDAAYQYLESVKSKLYSEAGGAMENGVINPKEFANTEIVTRLLFTDGLAQSVHQQLLDADAKVRSLLGSDYNPDWDYNNLHRTQPDAWEDQHFKDNNVGEAINRLMALEYGLRCTEMRAVYTLLNTEAPATAGGSKPDTAIPEKKDIGLSGAKPEGQPTSDEQPFTYVEQMPTASYDVDAYCASNLRYPPQAVQDKKEGRVIVKFVINKDGSTTEVVVARGIGDGCDEEAVRLISAMPKWNAGKQNGNPVRVRFTMSVPFKLPKN